MFRPAKSEAMAARFLALAPGKELNDLRLTKLMVIAERTAIAETTTSITGDAFYSLPMGPVLSESLNQLKGRGIGARSRCIEYLPKAGKRSNTFRLIAHVAVEDVLSEYEIGVIDQTWDRYKGYSKWELVDITHTFPEWDRSCKAKQTSARIELIDVLQRGLGLPPAVAQAKAAEIGYYESVAG
ncbi:MAG: Panacea domain-containing protein [Armatimonadetes bacterium]|nr:Panacea domain-containing protein [Armatimonadota bacterium]